MKENLTETPTTADFRRWVGLAVVETGEKPATISRAIGASINMVGEFLRDPKRGITLDRAASLEDYLRSAARCAGKELPPVKPAPTSLGVSA